MFHDAPAGDEFVVKVAWEGLEEAKSTWEPVSRRAGRAAQRAQGAAAQGGAEVGTRATVWVAFVILYVVIGERFKILSC